MAASHFRVFIGLGGQKVFSLVAAMLISILLARMLGPEGYGLYVFVSAFIPLAALPITGGLPQLLTREIGRHGQNASLNLEASAGGAMRLSRRVTIFFLMVCAAGLVSFESMSQPFLVCLCLLCVPFLAFEASYNGIIRGLQKPGHAEFPKQVFQPVILGVALLLLVLLGDLTPFYALVALLVATAASTLCSLVIYRRLKPITPEKGERRNTTSLSLKTLASFSAIALFASLNAQIGILVLGWLDQTTGAAALRIAERAGQLAILPLTIINLMIAPRVAAAFQEKRTDELQRLTTRAGRLSFVLTLPALPIIWFYGDWLIAFLFGEAYVTETLDAVIVLVAGQTAGLFFGSVWPLLIMTGHERQALNRLIMSCGLNLFLCLWLAPIYGAAGAALAAALSLIIWKFSFSVDIKKRLKINTNLL